MNFTAHDCGANLEQHMEMQGSSYVAAVEKKKNIHIHVGLVSERVSSEVIKTLLMFAQSLWFI